MDGIIDNLTSALNTWNSKLAEIWLLLTESPETFKGGDIWKVILKVHDALQAIGLALLVLFLCMGINQNLYKLARCEKTRTSLQTVPSVYCCTSIGYVWNGTHDRYL